MRYIQILFLVLLYIIIWCSVERTDFNSYEYLCCDFEWLVKIIQELLTPNTCTFDVYCVES